ncbi:hypothetical protein WA158_006188 [Blastocystis sp. Blastoise]
MKYFGFFLLFACVCLAVNEKDDMNRKLSNPPYDRSKTYANTDKVITVHILPHTHDDPGWLVKADQYYVKQVRYILDTVVAALKVNPTRKFSYVEQSFFQRWWNEQNEDIRNDVRKLVKNGQFEFNLGGWAMNDEATANYEDIISQMTLGAKFIYDEFGVRPTVGWHIDPFGHSSGLAQLFADIGLDAFGINRIHYQDKDQRKSSKNLEFMWRGAKSLGHKSDIFTHIMDSHYCSPDECDFFSNSAGENLYWTDDNKWYQWDEALPTFKPNYVEKAERFVAMVKSRSEWYDNGGHLIITWGCDFTHTNAFVAYANMDKLIEYVNANTDKFGVRVQYSVFSDYIKAVHEYDRTWGSYDKDFMPYADRAGAYWTGYYTSRQRLKYMGRQSRNEFNVADYLLSYADIVKADVPKDELYKKILILKKAHGEFQHHDAITGTEKQAVSDDYNVQMVNGLHFNGEAASTLLEKFTGVSGVTRNITVAWEGLNENNALGVILFNNVAWKREQTVRVVVPRKDIEVVDGEGKKIQSQINELPDYSIDKRNGTHALYFTVDMPALGYNTVYIKLAKESHEITARRNEEAIIENDKYALHVENGEIKFIVVKEENNRIVNVNGKLYQYTNNRGSGAYSFQPSQSEPDAVNYDGNSWTKVIKGDLLEEVQIHYKDGYSMTLRLYKDHTEFENIVELVYDFGPTDDGAEIVMRYNTELKNNKVVYADNNGLEMQERAFNEGASNKVGGNYYPTVQRVYIQDDSTRVTILEERAHGCASTGEGHVEIMLRRRTNNDDGYGVGEALKENDQGDIGLWTLVANKERSTKMYKTLDILYSHAIVPFFFAGEIKSIPTFSLLKEEMPKNIQILDFQLAGPHDDSYILRFHHLYEQNEDEELAKAVTLDVSKIFNNMTPSSMTEMQLTGMFSKEQVEKERLVWKMEGENNTNEVKEARHFRRYNPYEFTIEPMEFKTFKVTIN